MTGGHRFAIGVSTSTCSLISSATIMGMIGLSKKKLTTPYRRIIFSLGISDLIQSLAIMSGPFAPPKGTEFADWSRGNVTTCNLSGFLATNGFSLVPMYTACLCVYYVCKLRHGMSDQAFYLRVERYLHAAIVISNLLLTTTALFMGVYNSSMIGSCYYATFPSDCLVADSPNYGECERGTYKDVFIIIGGIGFPLLCLFTVSYSSVLLIGHARKKTLLFRARANDQGAGDNTNYTVRQPHETNVEYLSRLYMRESTIQAFLYISCFCFVYTVPCIVLVLDFLGTHNYLLQGDKLIPLLLYSIFPLGGVFNILVYCRPKVNAIRREKTDISWIKALWLVIMAGGEIPDSDSTERFSCCFKNRQDTNARQESDADGSMIANQLRIYQQYMRHRNRNNGSENVPDRSSNLNSDFVLNGLSETFEEDNPAFRSEIKWDHLRGDSSEPRQGGQNIQGEQQQGLSYDPEDEALYELMYGRDIRLSTDSPLEMRSGLSIDVFPSLNHDSDITTSPDEGISYE